jgi:hypothetical protein
MNAKKRDKKLAEQIIEEFHAAGQRGDVAAFKRLLGKYGAHLSREVKDELIAEFKRNVSALWNAQRDE